MRSNRRTTDVETAMVDSKYIAARLGVSLRTVNNLIAERRIPAPTKLGSLTRWNRQQFEEWLAAGAHPPGDSTEPRRQHTQHGDRPAVFA